MDAADILVAMLLIGAVGWIAWATIRSNRRAHETGQAAPIARPGAASQNGSVTESTERDPAQADTPAAAPAAKKGTAGSPRPRGRRND